MKILIRKGFELNQSGFRFCNKLKVLQSKRNYQGFNQNSTNQKWRFKMMLGVLSSFYVMEKKLKCEQVKQSQFQEKQNENEVEIYQLNKSQFLQLLANVNQEAILIVFDKYAKDKNENQFSQNLQTIYTKCKQLSIKKIYLIEKNDIAHLQTFERWLKNQPKKEESSSNSQSKNQYFFLSHHFANHPFKVQDKQITQQVQEIRKFYIRINPSDLSQQIFQPYQNVFNRTTVVKQCPEYTLPNEQNKCIEQYRSKIATLIEQRMLKQKSDQFKFFAITPKSKKDISPIVSFHSALKNYQGEISAFTQGKSQKLDESHKVQNTYVLRNDLIGRQIQNMKDFKNRNHSLFKHLSFYDRFLLFIRPRIFIVSKNNPSIDLYWYVTCLHKNKQATISINNTDSLNLGRKLPITNGLKYPLNSDLQFLKVLYKNHPQLNYLIINTQIVSELIRHLPVKRKYVIYELTPEIYYPKMFLPNYDESISPQENYKVHFKSSIQQFLRKPRHFSKVVLDKQKKINEKELREIMKNPNQKFLLRVCNKNCIKDIQSTKLYQAFQKFKELPTETLGKIKQEIKQIDFQNEERRWQNIVFQKTFWIDVAYNNVGLKEGQYIYINGKYEEL